MILTLLRRGLRAGEVAGLSLDDIGWRSAEIVVRGRGGRAGRLPLVAGVGEAIAAYLGQGRPRAALRQVFLRALAPITVLGRGGVSDIVLRACARAGIAPVRARRLRHTVACQMVAAGVSLPEIAEILRHSGRWPAAACARVDLERLRRLPFPGQEAREGDRLPPARHGLPAATPLARLQARAVRPGAPAARLLPGSVRRRGTHGTAGHLLGRASRACSRSSSRRPANPEDIMADHGLTTTVATARVVTAVTSWGL